MEHFINIIWGSSGGGLIVWLFKDWMTARLKQSISHEYSQKLESYKTELNKTILEIKHNNQINHLRTSLFFDHQREAFSEIITKLYDIREDWYLDYDPDEGLVKPVSSNLYDELNKLIAKHQIFLDDEILMSIDLLLLAYLSSFPFDDGSGESVQRDVSLSERKASYIVTRLHSIFKNKIGVSNNREPFEELASFGAINIVNNYNYSEVGDPINKSLYISSNLPADWVKQAIDNKEELITRLKMVEKYLACKGGSNKEHRNTIKYLSILDAQS